MTENDPFDIFSAVVDYSEPEIAQTLRENGLMPVGMKALPDIFRDMAAEISSPEKLALIERIDKKMAVLDKSYLYKNDPMDMFHEHDFVPTDHVIRHFVSNGLKEPLLDAQQAVALESLFKLIREDFVQLKELNAKELDAKAVITECDKLAFNSMQRADEERAKFVGKLRADRIKNEQQTSGSITP